jgi:deoxycytidylate deaminase
MTSQKSYLKQSTLKQVIAVAMASDAPKKMGAILLDRRNKLISTGVNSYEMTHTQQFYAAINAAKKYSQPSLAKKIWMHCELNCLLKARSEGSKLVICRVGGHGKTELRNSFCCPICYLYITKNHPSIKEIHWSTNDQQFLYLKLC